MSYGGRCPGGDYWWGGNFPIFVWGAERLSFKCAAISTLCKRGRDGGG